MGSSYIDSKSPTRNKKRRLADESLIESEKLSSNHYIQTQQNTSGIQIDLHDQSGKQIRLVNTLNKDVSLAGWKLSRKANDEKSEFKFGKNVVVKAGQHLNVWSCDAGVKQSLPHDLVMSAGNKWCVADAMVSLLVDKDDNVSFSSNICIFICILILTFIFICRKNRDEKVVKKSCQRQSSPSRLKVHLV